MHAIFTSSASLLINNKIPSNIFYTETSLKKNTVSTKKIQDIFTTKLTKILYYMTYSRTEKLSGCFQDF